MLLLIPSVAFAGLEHDGTDDLVSYADSTDWFFSGNFTVWARVEVFTFGTRQAILGQREDANNNWQFYFDDQNLLIFREFDAAAITISGASSSGGFIARTVYDVAVTKTGSTYAFYKDGEALGTFTDATGAVNHAGTLETGRVPWTGQFMNGVLYETAIWKGTTLSIQQIRQLSNSDTRYMPLQVSPATLKHYAVYNEFGDGRSASGTDAIKDYSSRYDVAVPGNHGDVTSAPVGRAGKGQSYP